MKADDADTVQGFYEHQRMDAAIEKAQGTMANLAVLVSDIKEKTAVSKSKSAAR